MLSTGVLYLYIITFRDGKHQIYESMLTEDEEFLSMKRLTLQMLRKVIYLFKSEYLFVDKRSAVVQCSTKIESPIQLCFQLCAGRERDHK